MKVGDTSNDKKIRENELVARSNEEQLKAKNTLARRTKGDDSEGRIAVGVGQQIQAELNPTALAATRRQRVEELKELVRAGKYNPPIMEVAARVAEELDAEIFSMKGRIPEEDQA
jgi:hypothetical protein